tara:strand:- start:260 stop:718 length:459 start_codon:yes stop_codon:yes gene_type:complete
MTSNLGSSLIHELTTQAAGADEIRDAVMEMVAQHFRPEFLNRVDEVVVFHPLGPQHIRDVTDIQLRRLNDRLGDLDISLAPTDAALEHIAASGFDPVYGARPLKRAIQTLVENPLSKAILSGEFTNGDTIEVNVGEEKLTFAKSGGLRPERR